ncbi:hypothetical protein [Flavobacterium sp.]|jgi:hypothetical protein
METTFFYGVPPDEEYSIIRVGLPGVRLSAVSPEGSGGCRFNP